MISFEKYFVSHCVRAWRRIWKSSSGVQLVELTSTAGRLLHSWIIPFFFSVRQESMSNIGWSLTNNSCFSLNEALWNIEGARSYNTDASMFHSSFNHFFIAFVTQRFPSLRWPKKRSMHLAMVTTSVYKTSIQYQDDSDQGISPELYIQSCANRWWIELPEFGQQSTQQSMLEYSVDSVQGRNLVLVSW